MRHGLKAMAFCNDFAHSSLVFKDMGYFGRINKTFLKNRKNNK